MEAAAELTQNLGSKAGLSLVVPEVNSMGLALFGVFRAAAAPAEHGASVFGALVGEEPQGQI